jgi:hypothetical protein
MRRSNESHGFMDRYGRDVRSTFAVGCMRPGGVNLRLGLTGLTEKRWETV